MQDATTPNTDDDLDTPLWGAEAMAPVLRRNPRDIYNLIKNERLDVTKVGGWYVSTKRRLRRSSGIE